MWTRLRAAAFREQRLRKAEAEQFVLRLPGHQTLKMINPAVRTHAIV
jgi:hypothetical protein